MRSTKIKIGFAFAVTGVIALMVAAWAGAAPSVRSGTAAATKLSCGMGNGKKATGTPIKLVGLLRYRPDMTREEANNYWRTTHGRIALTIEEMGHYVQNIGDDTLRFLEMFRSDRFADVSLNQWMALTPPELVRAHLNIDDKTIGALHKVKPIIVR